jgi:phage gp29-like protein
MKKLFKFLKKSDSGRELAPQVTSWQRTALQRPGSATDSLPYETYRAMETDAMIQTALTLKKLGVLASAGRVVPSSDSAEARRNAEFIESCFAQMDGSAATILDAAMDAFARGWSIQEAIYDYRDGFWWLRATRAKDPSVFGIDVTAFGEIEALRLEIPGESAIELPRAKFVIHTHRDGFGRPKGKSDLDAAYPHYVAKTTLLAAWKLHLERFASPTMLGSFGSGASTADQQTVLSALNSLASTTAIVFPNEFEISAIDPQTGASQGYMEAIEFHNREIARSILGQTLTTDEGRRVGSLALGRVHLQVLVLQLEAIRKSLADRVLTEQVIRPLIELNFGGREVPRYEFEPANLEVFQTGKLG